MNAPRCRPCDRFDDFGQPQVSIANVDNEYQEFRAGFVAWAEEFWPEAIARRQILLLTDE